MDLIASLAGLIDSTEHYGSPLWETIKEVEGWKCD